MKSRTISTIIACSVFLLITNVSIADSSAVRTMAKITMKLNHYPSDSDKEKLAKIAKSEDSSESEKAVATALLNMKHKVADGDKEKLSSIIGDDSISADLRTVAGVLLGINHRPSESDAEKLKAIASGPGD